MGVKAEPSLGPHRNKDSESAMNNGMPVRVHVKCTDPRNSNHGHWPERN